MSARKRLRAASAVRHEFLQLLEPRRLFAGGDMQMALTGGGAMNDYGKSTATDGAGNIYVFGFFAGTADFDPSAAQANLTAQGNTDDFLAKYSPSGALLWVRQIGGAQAEDAARVAVDRNGNVLVIGYYQGTTDLDPGAGVAQFTSTGGSDAFVEKLDSSGNFLWARAMTGPSSDNGVDVATDAAGNVYATFTAKITGYRPGPGGGGETGSGQGSGTLNSSPTGTVTVTGTAARDAYIVKFDADGNHQWTAGLNGFSNDLTTGLAVDGAGNVIATGYYLGQADFDPGPGVHNMTPSGGNDTFVWKLSPKGQLLFAGQIEGWSQEIALDIATDPSNNIYVTGYFFANADFDMGSGVYTLPNTGSDQDVYLAKYSPTGALLFARAFGGAMDESPSGIAIDSRAGIVYLTGRFQGTADFDPQSGVRNLTSAGADDIFVSALRASDGSYLYAQRYGSTGSDSGYSITTDAAGHVFTTGTFIGNVDFGSGTMHQSAGATDFFMTELAAFPSVRYPVPDWLRD